MTLGRTFTNASIFYGRPDAKLRPRKPLKTFPEIAEMLGVSHTELKVAVTRIGANPPAPLVKSTNRQSGQVRYYDPAEFRAWWASRSAA